jgi:hypothetical protein
MKKCTIYANSNNKKRNRELLRGKNDTVAEQRHLYANSEHTPKKEPLRGQK